MDAADIATRMARFVQNTFQTSNMPVFHLLSEMCLKVYSRVLNDLKVFLRDQIVNTKHLKVPFKQCYIQVM